ncbi:unnamed protein product [Absidia cylindrospora]
MVAVEKREKWLLETQLQTVQQQLTDEQAQLKELRQRLLQWDNEEQQRYKQHGKHKKKSAITGSSSSGKRSLINTTLKEEDENETSANAFHDDDANSNTDKDEHDDYDQDSDTDVDADDETWEDALDNQENMDDPQLRARHDLALLHGMRQKKQSHHHKQQHKATLTSIERSNTSTTLDQKKKQQPRSVSMPPLPPASKGYTIAPTIDQVQLEAFHQFVHSASTLPLKKLYQFAYMKYCQLEDVEPCLRFGPNSRLSVKKMMDYLLQQPCFIQQMSTEKVNAISTSHPQHNGTTTVIPSSVAQRSLLWDRWHSSNKSNNTTTITTTTTSTNSNKSISTSITAIGCAACGRPRQKDNNDMDITTYYQFKMDEKDDWLPMDQYCRDRLVAVCEFFVFIRNIHLRLYAHRTIDDLYSENIRLRLQMFYSRMGALPVILGGIGLNADSIGKACPPLDKDDVSDGSTSSQIPKTPK